MVVDHPCWRFQDYNNTHRTTWITDKARKHSPGTSLRKLKFALEPALHRWLSLPCARMCPRIKVEVVVEIRRREQESLGARTCVVYVCVCVCVQPSGGQGIYIIVRDCCIYMHFPNGASNRPARGSCISIFRLFFSGTNHLAFRFSFILLGFPFLID